MGFPGHARAGCHCDNPDRPRKCTQAIVKTMSNRERKKGKEDAVAAARGLQFLAERKHGEAYAFLQEDVQRFPDDADIRMHYAHSLLATRPDEAIPEIKKAIETDPDEPVRLTRAAGIVFKLGDVETARSYAHRAKELAPPNFPFEAYLINLINLDSHFAALEGKDELAEEGFRLAVEQEPDGETFAVDLARFLADHDRLSEALEVIDEALPRAGRREPLERLRDELLGEAEPD